MEEVRRIEKDDALFKVITESDAYLSKTVIVATGRKPRELKVPGGEEVKE